MAKIDSLAGNSERPELVPPTFQILPDGRSARAKGESSWPNSFVHLLNRFASGSGCEFAWKAQVPDHGNSAGPHLRQRKLRPHFRATFAAGGADEVRLDIRQPDMVGPAIRVDLGRVAATIIAAVNQHVADAAATHFAEGDFGR